MKRMIGKSLVLFAVIYCMNSLQLIGQDTLRYADLQVEHKLTRLKGNQSFQVYVDKLGNEISIDTELTLGSPLKSETGKFQTWGVRQLGLIAPVDKLMSGSKVLVKKIFIFKIGLGKRSSFIVNMDCEQIDKSLSKAILTMQYFDKSLENGETIFDGGVLNKEQAIELLKKKKELLDLEIIEQSEYDSLKKVLTPIIIKN